MPEKHLVQTRRKGGSNKIARGKTETGRRKKGGKGSERSQKKKRRSPSRLCKKIRKRGEEPCAKAAPKGNCCRGKKKIRKGRHLHRRGQGANPPGQKKVEADRCAGGERTIRKEGERLLLKKKGCRISLSGIP